MIYMEAKKQTGLTTHIGLCNFQSMPFGLVNAPATFRRFMWKSLQEYVCTYLDWVKLKHASKRNKVHVVMVVLRVCSTIIIQTYPHSFLRRLIFMFYLYLFLFARLWIRLLNFLLPQTIASVCCVWCEVHVHGCLLCVGV
jgi:hypothetical protein